MPLVENLITTMSNNSIIGEGIKVRKKDDVDANDIYECIEGLDYSMLSNSNQAIVKKNLAAIQEQVKIFRLDPFFCESARVPFNSVTIGQNIETKIIYINGKYDNPKLRKSLQKFSSIHKKIMEDIVHDESASKSFLDCVRLIFAYTAAFFGILIIIIALLAILPFLLIATGLFVLASYSTRTVESNKIKEFNRLMSKIDTNSKHNWTSRGVEIKQKKGGDFKTFAEIETESMDVIDELFKEVDKEKPNKKRINELATRIDYLAVCMEYTYSEIKKTVDTMKNYKKNKREDAKTKRVGKK